jgi:ABC-type multidrug transport system ATPase subunit
MLTPEEHLRLFASFKGTDPSIIEDLVEKMLEDLDLIE